MYMSGPPSDELQRHCSVKRQSQEIVAKLQRSTILGSWEMGAETSACSAARGGQMTWRYWADVRWNDKLGQRRDAPQIKMRRPEAELREASHLQRSLRLQS